MGTIGVGMPNWILLNQFGRMVFEAFGEWPYLVGSANKGKDWRDVDVRLILPDEEFARVVGKLTKPMLINRRWAALCLAFSLLGKHMTGLPIDFQIQQASDAQSEKGERDALLLCCVDY